MTTVEKIKSLIKTHLKNLLKNGSFSIITWLKKIHEAMPSLSRNQNQKEDCWAKTDIFHKLDNMGLVWLKLICLGGLGL